MPRRPKKLGKSDPSSDTVTPKLHPQAQRGILVILLFAFGALALLSFLNVAGRVGEWFAWALILFFGWGRFLVPVIVFALGYVVLFSRRYQWRYVEYSGFVLLLLSLFGMLHFLIPASEMIDSIPAGRGGGYIGFAAAWVVYALFGLYAGWVIFVALFLISVLLVFNHDAILWFNRIGGFAGLLLHMKDWFRKSTEEAAEASASVQPESTETPEMQAHQKSVATEDREPSPLVSRDDGGTQEHIPFPIRHPRRIEIPLSLLQDKTGKATARDIAVNRDRIQTTLKNFGIEVTMHDIHVGPTVTQYELKPADGVKLSQILALKRDLALALAAHPIRIEAPIPGKALVGIEVPNQSVALVRLKELLQSTEFKKRHSHLTFVVGKDVAGKVFLADLGKMPHVLIAGATGSGKSVAINSVILSLLFQNSPATLRLILIDPKRVELTVYNEIPYLLTPVITDYEKTVNALKWAVGEMDRRYEILSQAQKRHIDVYNASVAEKLPYIVIIIDELADLMVTAARDIEAIIVRLAQMARAVGIHLILSTQRPSVDVITGLIKANITTRMAFAVASIVDSRTILDFQGAESLLGNGDMLYISAELSKPKRLQGTFIDDAEINNVVEFLRKQQEPDYNEAIIMKQSRVVLPGVWQDPENNDELLDEAKRVIIGSGKASASLLQRRLRVGYARAARILDILEEQGIIGPADGAKPREILITSEEGFDTVSAEDGDVDETEDDVPPLRRKTF